MLSDGFLVTINGQKEINSLTFLIDSAVEVFPLTLDLDVRFVRPPALADRPLLAFAESGSQFRRELMDPAVDVRVIDLYTPAPPSFLSDSRVRRVSQVPTDTG